MVTNFLDICFKGNIEDSPNTTCSGNQYHAFRGRIFQQLFHPICSATVFLNCGEMAGLKAVKRCAATFLALPFDSCFCCPSVTGREVLNWRVEEMQLVFGQTGICLLSVALGPWNSSAWFVCGHFVLTFMNLIEPWTSPWAWYLSEQRFHHFQVEISNIQ